jgi:hypothetical protein
MKMNFITKISPVFRQKRAILIFLNTEKRNKSNLYRKRIAGRNSTLPFARGGTTRT